MVDIYPPSDAPGLHPEILATSGGGGSGVLAPPTGVSAVYTVGIGATLNWTPPLGYTGAGYYIYRISNFSLIITGTQRKMYNESPYTFVPWGTNSFVDRQMGYPPLRTGDNIYTYYITTVALGGRTESNLSTATSPITFLG